MAKDAFRQRPQSSKATARG